MRLGQMNHLMTIENPTGRTNAYGEVAAEYAAVGRAWCSMAPTAVKVDNPDSSRRGRVEVRMTTHYTPLITTDSRLVYGDRIFYVSSVIDVDGQHRELSIVAWE